MHYLLVNNLVWCSIIPWLPVFVTTIECGLPFYPYNPHYTCPVAARGTYQHIATFSLELILTSHLLDQQGTLGHWLMIILSAIPLLNTNQTDSKSAPTYK